MSIFSVQVQSSDYGFTVVARMSVSRSFSGLRATSMLEMPSN